MKDGKAWVRQFIAIVCTFAIVVYSGFALFGNIDMAVFWRIFGTLNFYLLWFFTSRQIEKREK